MIDFCPPKLELPPTVLTVSLTEAVRSLIPVIVTVQGDDEHVPDPVAPLLHVQAMLVETGDPFCVTVITTLAFQRGPAFTAFPWSDTTGIGAVTVTLCVALPVAPSSSVAVSVTPYVPADV